MLGNCSMKALMFIFLAVIISCGNCFAGAWTADKGSFYHKLSMNYYRADKGFDSEEESEDYPANGKFSDRNLGYYAEYGVLDSLTAVGSVSYKWMEWEDDNRVTDTYGYSDIELGLKYRLYRGYGGAFSVQTLVKIPELYDDDDALPVGNGQYDGEIRLLYGQSLFPQLPAYFNVEAGYRFRAEEPADELRYLVEFGLDFTKTFFGRVKLDGIYGMDNHGGSDSANPSATTDYDLGKLDMALGWKVSPKFCLEIGCRPDIYGRNSSSGVNWSFAVIFKQ